MILRVRWFRSNFYKPLLRRDCRGLKFEDELLQQIALELTMVKMFTLVDLFQNDTESVLYLITYQELSCRLCFIFLRLSKAQTSFQSSCHTVRKNQDFEILLIAQYEDEFSK